MEVHHLKAPIHHVHDSPKPGRRKRLARTLKATTLALAIVTMTGCQLAYLFAPEATEEIQPEYTIGESSVAIVVWADQSIKDEYPQARRQIGRSLAHHLQEGCPDAKVVSARRVEDLQEDPSINLARMSTNELCEKLDCDYILRVDLEDFTTRASHTPHLKKARIDATINLYKKAERETIESVYQDEIRTLYPPESKHGAYDMDERDLMHAAIEFFSIKTAEKFYAHEILLEDKRD